MSEEISEESSSSSVAEVAENDDFTSLSSFHIQPSSLSHGYESLPDSCQYLISEPYENSDIVARRKSRIKHRAPYWHDFKYERRLCQAVSMNHTAAVAHLLEQGVSASCRDKLQRSPLHHAACKGYAHIVKMLLQAGADVNARDPIGNTPLHLAACTQHIDVVLLLLQAGGDGLSVDKLGRSPLQLAQSKLKILQKSYASDQEVKSQVTQVIDLLLLFSGNSADSERLEEIQKKVSSAESRDQVHNQLRDLLDSLNSLSINPS